MKVTIRKPDIYSLRVMDKVKVDGRTYVIRKYNVNFKHDTAELYLQSLKSFKQEIKILKGFKP